MPKLLAATTSSELTEWMAYDDVEGLPDRRVELLLAQLLALMTNVHRDPDRSQPATVTDFMPWLNSADAEEPAMPTTNLLEKIEHLNVVFGGTDLRGSRSNIQTEYQS